MSPSPRSWRIASLGQPRDPALVALHARCLQTAHAVPFSGTAGGLLWTEFPALGQLAEPVANAPSHPLEDSDLIIVWQDEPSQFAPRDIQHLLGLAPLAGVWVIAGPWCASEVRHGSRWPAAVLVDWWQAEARWQSLLAAIQAGDSPPWWPPTSTREEVLRLTAAASQATLSSRGSRVALFSPDLDLREAWRAVLEGLGAIPITMADHAALSAALTDFDELWLDYDPAPYGARALQQVRAAEPTLPILVWSHWPIDDSAHGPHTQVRSKLAW